MTLQHLKQKARELKKYLTILARAAKDSRVPVYGKILAGATVFYAFLPFDLIPDWIPVLGLLDDLVIVPLGIYLSIRAIPKDVFDSIKAEIEQEEKVKEEARGEQEKVLREEPSCASSLVDGIENVSER